MTDTDADAAAIEAELERDRDALSSTLDELQDRLSFDHLAEEALDMLRGNASHYLQLVDRAVRANPLALALVAGGVAWLMLGGRGKSRSSRPEALSRWEGEGGSPGPLPAYTPAADEDADWLRNVDSLRDNAREQLRELKDGASSAVGEVRDFAADKARVLADLAEAMKKGFTHGLENLTEEAQARIVTARKAAYAARLKAGRALSDSLTRPGVMVENHPFVAGGIALAAGAAVAAALPRTETEDRLFGTESDRLMRAASRALSEERERAMQMAGAMAEDLKDSARDALDTMTDVAVNRVREMADAVTPGSEESQQRG